MSDHDDITPIPSNWRFSGTGDDQNILRPDGELALYGEDGDAPFDGSSVGLTATRVKPAIIEVAENTGGTITYATMAALRAVAPVNDATRYTLSYSTLGDGGGGEWLGVTGDAPGTYTHNGGSVVVPDDGDGSAAWLRQNIVEVDSRWFGFSPDATGAANSAALIAMAALNLPIYIATEGTHYISGAGATITRGIRGVAGPNTVLRASGAEFPFILQITGSRVRVSDLFVHGDLVAVDGVVVDNAPGADFQRFYSYYSRNNGVVVEISGNNIGCSYSNCVFALNGYAYSTGTATASAGDTTVPISGAADLTTLGLAEGGEMFVYFQDEVDAATSELPALLHELISVAAAQITIYPPLDVALTGSNYVIVAGCGHRTRAHNASGSSTFSDCTFLSNNGPGFVDRGLFGAQHRGSILESNLGSGGLIGASASAAVPVRVEAHGQIGTFAEVHNCGDLQYAHSRKGVLAAGPGALGVRLTYRSWPGSEGPATVENFVRPYTVGAAVVAYDVLSENSVGLLTVFECTSACTATLVPESLRTFEVGTVLNFCQSGPGPITMAGGVGVTVNFRDGRDTSSGAGSYWHAHYLGSDEWEVWAEGDALVPRSLGLHGYTASGLPSAADYTSRTILVTDGGPGGAPALFTSDGTNWRRGDGNVPAAGLYVPYLTYPSGRSVAGKPAAGAGLGTEITLGDNQILGTVGTDNVGGISMSAGTVVKRGASGDIVAGKADDEVSAFVSADGKRTIMRISAGAPQNNASLADGATETFSYPTTTNRAHDVVVEFSFTSGGSPRVLQYWARGRNVLGTVTIQGEAPVRGPTIYSPALGVTLDASVSGTNLQFTLLNSTGSAITDLRTRAVSDEEIDYS